MKDQDKTIQRLQTDRGAKMPMVISSVTAPKCMIHKELLVVDGLEMSFSNPLSLQLKRLE
jgi:hypothetical protein